MLPDGSSAAGKRSLFGKLLPELPDEPLDQASWQKVENTAQRIDQRKKKRQERLEEAEASAPQKKVVKVSNPVRWNHKDAPKEQNAGLDAGCALVVSKEAATIAETLRRKGFKIWTGQVSAFLAAAWTLSSRRKVGHLVVVNNLAFDNLSVAALACRLCGGFLCEEQEILRAVARGSIPTGIQQLSSLKDTVREIFVEDDVFESMPGLLEVLQKATELPGSKLRLVTTFKKFQKNGKSTKTVMGPAVGLKLISELWCQIRRKP